MTRHRTNIRFALALVVFWAGLATASNVPNATARILAGLDVLPAAQSQVGAAPATTYSRSVAETWDRYQRRVGVPLDAWARKELDSARGGTVFYPFSGPDFLTVHALYPDADRYVLVAMQRAEPLPPVTGVTSPEVAALMQRFAKGWEQFAHLGFYRTLDLDAESARAGLRVGASSVLSAFAVRLGYEVLSVEPVRVNDAGSDLEQRWLGSFRQEKGFR